MDHKIVSAINRALFHQKAQAHVRILTTKRNAKGTITPITQPNATAEMAVRYRDTVFTPATNLDQVEVDVEKNESWHRPNNYAVPSYGTWGMAQRASESCELNWKRRMRML